MSNLEDAMEKSKERLDVLNSAMDCSEKKIFFAADVQPIDFVKIIA